MFLRARHLLPLCAPPIENGAVLISGGTILAAGPFRELAGMTREAPQDLGDSTILPGLINAHCHLDYTGMAGLIAPPKSFADWIKAILAIKAHWSYSEYAASWLAGARMLLESGVTTVCDIEAVPELLPDLPASTPLRVFSLIELTGVRDATPLPVLVRQALDQTGVRPDTGLSPHAPYSTTEELLKLTAKVARQTNLRLSTHIAESLEEFEMFTARRGPLFHWLKHERNMDDCDGRTPVEQMARNGILRPGTLAVHLNYLGPGDLSRLQESGVTAVHCPRSHAYFRHQAFAWPEMQRAGIPVCLGTDSLASVRSRGRMRPRLDLFAEMRAFAATAPQLPPSAILDMVTSHPARALGLPRVLGALTKGAKADLIVLRTPGPMADPCETVLHHQGPVAASLINGRWATGSF